VDDCVHPPPPKTIWKNDPGKSLNIQKSQHQPLVTEKLHTSSSLSDVSESVEAAGLLTGSSCSSESTRFLLARDSSSCKK